MHNATHSSGVHWGNAESVQHIRCKNIRKKKLWVTTGYSLLIPLSRESSQLHQNGLRTNVTTRWNNTYYILRKSIWAKSSAYCVHSRLWSSCNIRYKPMDITWKLSLFSFPLFPTTKKAHIMHLQYIRSSSGTEVSFKHRAWRDHGVKTAKSFSLQAVRLFDWLGVYVLHRDCS